MFDNVLYQSATHLLKDDITKNNLPGSLLFSGPASSGKLSTALELSRILSCQEKGEWKCTCPSCKKNKALVNQNVIITGPCDRTIEIKASSDTFLNQAYNNTSHLEASRYLFIRSVRKLTSRFNPMLWEDSPKLSKFAPILENIESNLELISPGRTLPENEDLQKIVDSLYDDCVKLSDGYLYDQLPVSQIRNFSKWARLSSSSGKKVLIIENADRMNDASRNAILKILEEPPKDTLFVLTTSNRMAIIPTILSRLRNYMFFERSVAQQQTVIDRVFHFIPKASQPKPESIDAFLQNYLPVTPFNLNFYATKYLREISEGVVPNLNVIADGCGKFSPILVFKAFLNQLIKIQSKLMYSPKGCEASTKIVKYIQETYNNVDSFNQNPVAALEVLTRNLRQVNYYDKDVLKDLFADE